MSPTSRICRILSLDPLNENRCGGLRKDGQPCNNIVAQHSRLAAYDIFRDCAELSLDARQLRPNLKDAAKLLLCKRWHQNQYKDLVDEWLGYWPNDRDNADSAYDSLTEDERERRRSRRPHHPIRSSATRSGNTASTSAAPASDFERLVRSVLNSDIPAEMKLSILGNATTNVTNIASTSSSNRSDQSPRSSRSSQARRTDSSQPSSTPRSSASSRNATMTPVSSDSEVEFPLSPSRSRTTADAPDTQRRTNSRTSSRSEASRSSRREPSTSQPEQLSPNLQDLPDASSSPATSSPATTPEPLRFSHVECSICFGLYDNAHYDDFWECTECQNRVHLDCQRQWAGSDPRTTRCVYCRAIVPPQL